jgi:hypothetical protein
MTHAVVMLHQLACVCIGMWTTQRTFRWVRVDGIGE